MFDVFYLDDIKPNLFAHEQHASSVEQARQRSRTRYFWIVSYLCDYSTWDFLWEPVPWQAQQCHAWSSQWQKDSGTYLVPKIGYQETNYHNDRIINRFPCKENWHLPPDLDDAGFDFSWHPDPTEPPLSYQFGTQWQPTGGPRYRVAGASEVKYVNVLRMTKKSVDKFWQVPPGIDNDSFDWTWHPDDRDPPYIYQFGTQWQRTSGPRYVVPGAILVKYVDNPRASKTSKDHNWQIPDQWVFDDGFDWTWHPDDRDPPYIYQFGTQHQLTGGPRYVVDTATQTKYVDQVRITVQTSQVPVFIIDHLDGNVDRVRQEIGDRSPIVKSVRFVDNYLDTFRRLAAVADDDIQYAWICSSVCDYSQHDFTWHPEQWQASMLHVFASDNEKFGDTFFIHLPSFRQRAQQCELLEWYDLNFVSDHSVPRRSLPMIKHDYDSQVDAIKRCEWTGPLAVLCANNLPDRPLPTVPLWRKKTRAITKLNPSGSAIIVPRDAVSLVGEQVYDYSEISKGVDICNDQPLDIVFISNGESTAAAAFEALEKSTLWRPNIKHRVDGVKGRVAAYHAAASVSTTPWFFAVFAKLFVGEHFDWSWQPDRLQKAKHYIFHARNPVNGLEYGHQAMIAYNKSLVLANTGRGLDFTLDDAHEVVPLLSGVAFYADTPWMAWRTAFREAIKLRASLPDVENEYRLSRWLAPSTVANGNWSQWGAEDALEYYDSVAGDPDQLRLSYEWAWLASYAFMKRKLVPDS